MNFKGLLEFGGSVTTLYIAFVAAVGVLLAMVVYALALSGGAGV